MNSTVNSPNPQAVLPAETVSAQATVPSVKAKVSAVVAAVLVVDVVAPVVPLAVLVLVVLALRAVRAVVTRRLLTPTTPRLSLPLARRVLLKYSTSYSMAMRYD